MELDQGKLKELEEMFGVNTDPVPGPFDLLDQAERMAKELGIEFTDIDWTSTADENEQKHKEEKRLKWVGLCGCWSWAVDPTTGRHFRRRVQCNYWRLCEYCARVRALSFYDRYVRAGEQAALGVVQGDKKTVSKLIRRIKTNGGSKGDYWRIPTVDGAVLLYNRAYLDVETEIEPDDIDWNELAITPECSRVSGDLGKKEEIPVGEHITVNTECVIVHGLDDPQIRNCFDRAESKMYRAHPKYDAEHISYCCWERMVTAKKFIEEAGGEIVDKYTIRMRVYKEQFISWEKRLNEQDGEESIAETVFKPPIGPPKTFEEAYNELFVY